MNERRKLHRAWAMYDWANSAYNLVITSTIFPAYYAAVTKANGGNVRFFGATLKGTALFDYSLAAAYLVIAFLSPVLSSVADYAGNKKRFMMAFCYLGAACCCGLYFFPFVPLELGMALFAVAALGFCGSLVFYNAFLPEIATPEEQDRVSAMGFSYGYVGSVLLMVVCLLFVLKPEWFGIADSGFAPRLSFLLTGLWWFGWAQIPLRRLPDGTPASPDQRHLLTRGFEELSGVWKKLRAMPLLKTYLFSFFFYSMGVQTVMLAAALFGSNELHMDAGSLITTILIIQLVAIAGAAGMAKLSVRFGNLRVLMGTLFVWIAVCVLAFFTRTATQFYGLAVLVGIIMGGVQSLSRSTYSKLMPATRDTASFFSFYDVTEKVAIVIGMLVFGIVDQQLTMRYSILALIAFFAIGAIIMYLAIRKQDTPDAHEAVLD